MLCLATVWTIDVWTRPNGTRSGLWKPVGTVETSEEAREAVLAIAKQYGLARASSDGSADEIRGMQASKTRGFCCWTGSGGGQ